MNVDQLRLRAAARDSDRAGQSLVPAKCSRSGFLKTVSGGDRCEGAIYVCILGTHLHPKSLAKKRRSEMEFAVVSLTSDFFQVNGKDGGRLTQRPS